MALPEKTVLNMVNCGGQCYGMSNQELNFWISILLFSGIYYSLVENQTSN